MQTAYESPKLVLVGGADEVVLGAPGMGYDGSFGMLLKDFEYQQD
jgi:hypothetical protein